MAVIRAPVMPHGWPSAMAPPLTLSLSSGTPRSSADGSTWAAKASLSSTRSTSPMLIPARASACRDASTGPMPMISGESAVSPVETIRASGVSPSSFARVSLMTTSAAAPSFMGHALPAVTVPSGRNTGLSWETASSVVPARGLSSCVTSVPSGSVRGAISRSQNPESRACSARLCERTA